MSNEFRLYYECYEQALHFFIPAIESIKPKAQITLIKISKLKKTTILAKNISNALFLKNPDAVITQVINNIETPLIWLELSTAVETQDHDLQRFDSIVAAALSRIPFAKVWAKKSSSSDHGGQTNYDETLSYKISNQALKNVAVALDWPLSEDKLSALRDEIYKACPPKATQLQLIHFLLLSIEGNENKSDPSFYFNENKRTEKWLKDQINDYLKPINIIYPNNSTRLYSKNKDWFLKINRWSHAMDPERGMAFFYRYYFKTLLIGTLIEKDATSAKESIANFIKATGIKLKTSLGSGTHDITREIAASAVNRSGLAIILNCKSFEILDNKGRLLISFYWSPPSLQKIISNRINIQNLTAIKTYNNITEDEVTYAVAFGVYPSNGFLIESISYPGAQGDKALMEGVGKKASRTYIDVVAIKSIKPNSIISLTESKGNKTIKGLKDDADKMISWKNDVKRKGILLKSYNLGLNTIINCSIAYPAENMISVPNSNNLDFCITFNNDEWNIWTKAASIPQGFSKGKLQGKVKFLNRFSY